MVFDKLEQLSAADISESAEGFSEKLKSTVSSLPIRRRMKISKWRELSYQEQIELARPYCLAVYDQNGYKFVLNSPNAIVYKQLKEFLIEMFKPTILADEPPVFVLLHRFWKQADADGDESLSRREINKFLKDLNLSIPKEALDDAFQRVDKDKNHRLDFEEFKLLYISLSKSPKLDTLSRSLSDHQSTEEAQHLDGMIQRLQGFFKDIQKEDLDSAKLTEMITVARGSQFLNSQQMLEDIHFTFRLLLSNIQNCAIDPWKLYYNEEYHQELERPLNHYFISSSHNTYLSGDQLRSKSTLFSYQAALEAGCRCVEIDCWDGKDGVPVVYHGFTLTTKLKFPDVIQTIKEFAFDKSDLPLILSLENHCSVPQQDAMAKTLIEVLGIENIKFLRPGEVEKVAPSPLALRRKFLIKGAKLRETLEEEEEDTDEEEEELSPTKKPAHRAEQNRVQPGGGQLKHTAGNNKKKPKVSKALSDITYIGSAPPAKVVKSWKDGDLLAAPSMHPSDCCSLKENVLEKGDLQEVPRARAVMQSTQKSLFRIYPLGSRVGSTNYMPSPHWGVGSQLVALNFQNIETPMRVNQALFNVGGRCGYVQKPPSRLLSRKDATECGQSLGLQAVELTVEVISGHWIPLPFQTNKVKVINPFVKAMVLYSGLSNKGPVDMTVEEKRTDTVYDNGFNPEFQKSDGFKFLCSDSECDMLMLEVWTEHRATSVMVGYFCARVCDLRQGYRFVPLYGLGGKLMANTLDDPTCPGLLVKLAITPTDKQRTCVSTNLSPSGIVSSAVLPAMGGLTKIRSIGKSLTSSACDVASSACDVAVLAKESIEAAIAPPKQTAVAM
uniref:Phosphoinositide phospholipase C n=1 Tax=Pyramimonas obovata TaxID=1411642 RepID=A0A7S0RM02_9CHLO